MISQAASQGARGAGGVRPNRLGAALTWDALLQVQRTTVPYRRRRIVINLGRVKTISYWHDYS